MDNKSSKRRYNEDQEENLVQELLMKYVPYWPLFVLLITLG